MAFPLLKERIKKLSDGNRELAREKFEKALKLIKKTQKNYNVSEISEAVNLCLEAIDISPKYSEPYFLLGYMSFKMEEYEDALKLILKVIELQPENKEAKELLETIRKNGRKKEIGNVLSKKSKIALKEKMSSHSQPIFKDIFSKIKKVFSPKKNIETNNISEYNPVQNQYTEEIKEAQKTSTPPQKNNFYSVIRESRNNLPKK